MKKNIIVSFLCTIFGFFAVAAKDIGFTIDNSRIKIQDSTSKKEYVRIFDKWESFNKIEINGSYCYKIIQNRNIVRDSLVAYFSEEEKLSFSIEVRDSTLFLTSNYTPYFIDSTGMGRKTDTVYIVVDNVTNLFGFGNSTICANLEGSDSSQYTVKIQGVSEYKGNIIGGSVSFSLADASVAYIDIYTENLSVKMNNACEVYIVGYAEEASFLLKSHSLLNIEDLSMSNLDLYLTDKSKVIMSGKKQHQESEGEERELYIKQKISQDSELIIN